VWLEGLGKLKKSIHPIGTRTSYLPACSIADQPLRTACTCQHRVEVSHRLAALEEFDAEVDIRSV
jgi:hypothetical protein